MNGGVTVAVLSHAEEPGLAGTLDGLVDECRALPGPVELLVIINGAVQVPSRALVAAMKLFASRGVRASVEDLERIDGRKPGSGLVARLVESCHGGKAWAWNRAREKAGGACVVFCDADLRLERGAIGKLWQALDRSPEFYAASATPVALTGADSSFTARASALRYQFDFRNLFGGLYAVRASAPVPSMPEGLLTEDAWLSTRLGRGRILRVPEARAFFLPAASLHEYFWERVRTEAGKLQLAKIAGPACRQARSQYPWREFASSFAARDYLLAAFTLGIRAIARLWARVQMRRGDPLRLWRLLPSTKSFPGTRRGAAATSSPNRRDHGKLD